MPDENMDETCSLVKIKLMMNGLLEFRDGCRVRDPLAFPARYEIRLA